MPSLGLLGFTISDDRFYELATTGAAIDIDTDRNVLTIGGETFHFALSPLEKRLTEIGGITDAFSKFGKRIYDVLAGGGGGARVSAKVCGSREDHKAASLSMAW